MVLRDLEIFVEVARKGNFAAVARDRDVDATTIARSIQSLEAELGIPLFTRTTRRVTLTDSGERYLDRVGGLIEDLIDAGDEARALHREPRGRLRIQGPVSFSELNVLPLLPGFFQAHPGVEIDLILSDEPLDLLAHRIDIALRLGPIQLASSHRVSSLAQMVSRVVATPTYLQRNDPISQPSDVAHHPCLLLDMPGFGGQWFYRASETGPIETVNIAGPLRTSNAIALKQMTLSHVGLSLQADWMVGKELASGDLVDVFPSYEWTASFFGNAMFVVLPPGSRMPRKTKVFLDYLRHAFRSGPIWSVFGRLPAP